MKVLKPEKCMSLEEVSRDKNNNLNFIRFIAAIMVILGHAYPLSGEKSEWLARITTGQASLGGWAVCIFFFFSGFWLCRSVQKNPTFYEFFKARCIRIFPCLIAVVFICTFVLGSLTTELSLQEYFSNIHTYRYLLNSLFILQHNLPGVFEHNIYGAAVNGSLWTLPVEFLCYIACYLAWRTGILTEKKLKYTVPIFIIGYVLLSVLSGKLPLIFSVLRPCGMFYLGMLCNVYRKYISITPLVVFWCILGLIVSAFLHLLRYSVLLFMPYILIYLSFGTRKKLSSFGKKYELSYGMYLCAFPIQQTVTMLSGGSMKPIMNFIVSIPIVLLTAFFLHTFTASLVQHIKIFRYKKHSRRIFYAASGNIDHNTRL